MCVLRVCHIPVKSSDTGDCTKSFFSKTHTVRKVYREKSSPLVHPSSSLKPPLSCQGRSPLALASTAFPRQSGHGHLSSSDKKLLKKILSVSNLHTRCGARTHTPEIKSRRPYGPSQPGAPVL